MLVMGERLSRAVETVQPARRSDPERPYAVLVDSVDCPDTQALRVIEAVLIMGECSGRPIKAVQSAAGTDPQLSVPVCIDHVHLIIRQRRSIIWIMLVHGELVTVVSVEAALRTKPHEPLLILKNRGHNALGEAIRNRQALERHLLLWGECPSLGSRQRSRMQGVAGQCTPADPIPGIERQGGETGKNGEANDDSGDENPLGF